MAVPERDEEVVAKQRQPLADLVVGQGAERAEQRRGVDGQLGHAERTDAVEQDPRRLRPGAAPGRSCVRRRRSGRPARARRPRGVAAIWTRAAACVAESSSAVWGSVAGRARRVCSRSATAGLVAGVTRQGGPRARRRPGRRIAPARPPRAWLRLETLPSGSPSARVAERAPRSIPRMRSPVAAARAPTARGNAADAMWTSSSGLATSRSSSTRRARSGAGSSRRASGRGLATLVAAPGSNRSSHVVRRGRPSRPRSPGPDPASTGGGDERGRLERARAARSRRSRRR